MITTHNLGFPRIGQKRELKKTLESYWKGEISLKTLKTKGDEIQLFNWALQKKAGLSLLPLNDFSYYDHVLDMSFLLGVIPERFRQKNINPDLNTYFTMARGQAPNGQESTPLEMTKWFNTNYHYIVPELSEDQRFHINDSLLLEQLFLAKNHGYHVKPVLLGPLSFLHLSKSKSKYFDKLSLLPQLIEAYQTILSTLHKKGVTWIQIDEPILVLDLETSWQQAFKTSYDVLAFEGPNLLLTTYFGSIRHHLALIKSLPVQGLHIDCVEAPEQLSIVTDEWPIDRVLSLGLINGRNIWLSDLLALQSILKDTKQQRRNAVWLAPSCSLLHVPIDLEYEKKLDDDIKSWLAFAKQKIEECVLLANSIFKPDAPDIQKALSCNAAAIQSRHVSTRIHKQHVNTRLHSIKAGDLKRQSNYVIREKKQQAVLNLPLLPTTTIGSFPQTQKIRQNRSDYKRGEIDRSTYESTLKEEIQYVIHEQEKIGLDVLVHGEAERNDMVEYFGELLDGFAFTQHGWVQSYGSRYVKPPIIYGDIERTQPMTVNWSQYANNLTQKPVKAMLTGPVTILAWSFVRDDQDYSQTAYQCALALRDEVSDLESAGLQVIQIDEPAFRESLPLRKADWPDYLDWAIKSFRLASSCVKDETQIHTHMCYAEFNDIIDAISQLDADVITLETSRSDLALLDAFSTFHYPNAIGPGVYDIHSPNLPTAEGIKQLLIATLNYIAKERLWVNPDCGLKTRRWEEVRPALHSLVDATKDIRALLLSEHIKQVTHAY